MLIPRTNIIYEQKSLKHISDIKVFFLYTVRNTVTYKQFLITDVRYLTDFM